MKQTLQGAGIAAESKNSFSKSSFGSPRPREEGLVDLDAREAPRTHAPEAEARVQSRPAGREGRVAVHEPHSEEAGKKPGALQVAGGDAAVRAEEVAAPQTAPYSRPALPRSSKT